MDGRRARGILANVFRERGEVLSRARIWIDIRVQSGSALVIIEDEGVGIPDSELELVFRRSTADQIPIRLTSTVWELGYSSARKWLVNTEATFGRSSEKAAAHEPS